MGYLRVRVSYVFWDLTSGLFHTATLKRPFLNIYDQHHRFSLLVLKQPFILPMLEAKPVLVHTAEIPHVVPAGCQYSPDLDKRHH
jgi:hypothetical protein